MATAAKMAKVSPRMSDVAVKAKTGKEWKEWFGILDRAGAKKMSHQEIAKYLHTDHAVGPWWTQMVTVTYEQERGLRDKHQKPNGYEISVSRTINSPVSSLYKAFADEKIRSEWLGPGELVLRKATANKSLRMMWHNRKTSLAIAFVSKGENKSQVIVQHSKLPDNKSAAKMKVFWSKALDRLRGSLETK